ncbi:MAG: sulfite exporter TauE/SafE family protein [Planctomycetota bacterium]
MTHSASSHKTRRPGHANGERCASFTSISVLWNVLEGAGSGLGLILKGITLAALLLAGSAAMLIGISKTGIPGVGMPAIALMAEAFPNNTRHSVGAMVPLLVFGDLFAIFYYRRHAVWNRLFELAPYVLAGMVPGYFVLHSLESSWLRALIGLIILGLLGLHLARERLGEENKMPHSRWFAALMGCIAGFGTVVGNAAGPAMAVYFLAKRLDKREFIGTAAWFFFFVNISKVPIQWNMGIITPETLRLDLCAAPLLVVGAFTGVAIHKRISQQAFNTAVLLLAALFAIRLMGTGLFDMVSG